MQVNSQIKILTATTENISELGIYCIKDKKSPGYSAKLDWFKTKIKDGLTLKIALDQTGKQLGFIEYISAELAWRPIVAKNYLFIHCIALFAKDARELGIGSALLQSCETDTKALGKQGICAMSSEGVWMANKSLFEKNGFLQVDQLDRFELMSKTFEPSVLLPKFINWNSNLQQYKGWHLIFSNQCPWHQKSVLDLQQAAKEHQIVLNIKQLKSPEEAKQAPSGFGTFSLIKDGKLLADHYISRTRFENILKKEK